MKVKEVTLSKNFKIGLPQYSNIDICCSIKWEVGEGEEINWANCWDEINYQLKVQSEGIDPSWMIDKKDYKNFFQVTVKIPKKEIK